MQNACIPDNKGIDNEGARLVRRWLMPFLVVFVLYNSIHVLVMKNPPWAYGFGATLGLAVNFAIQGGMMVGTPGQGRQACHFLLVSMFCFGCLFAEAVIRS